MTRGLTLLFIALVSCTSSGPSGQSSRPDFPGEPLSTIGTRFVRPSDGATVLLRGINFSNRFKSPPYTEPHTADDLKVIRGLGMNAVRFVTTWKAIEPTQGSYNDSYLTWLDGMLDAAVAEGLYVILDMHQDLYGGPFASHGAPDWTCPDAKPFEEILEPWFLNALDPSLRACFDRFYNEPEVYEAFGAMWGMLAARYADHPAVVGFEILNEPYFGTHNPLTFDEEVLGDWTSRIASKIRENAPSKLVVFEPSVAKSADLPLQFPKMELDGLVYAPHLYHSSTEFGNAYVPGHPLFAERLEADLAEADFHEAPLLIGEWGAIQSWGDERPDLARALIDEFYAEADRRLVSSTFWEYSGIFKTTDGETKLREWATSLIRPTLHAFTGEVKDYICDRAVRSISLNWTFDDGAFLEFRMPDDVEEPSLSGLNDAIQEREGDVWRVRIPRGARPDSPAAVSISY